MAVRLVEPGLSAVTRPAALTVATAVLLEAQVTALLEALLGLTVAVRAMVSPTEREAEPRLRLMLATRTVVDVLEELEEEPPLPQAAKSKGMTRAVRT